MLLKITRNGKTVSWVRINKGIGTHEISYIRTEEGERGKGYASMLLERAKRQFPSLIAFLDDDGTGLTVDQMREWYKRHGFKQGKWDLERIGNVKRVMMWESDLLIANATK